MGAWTQRKTTMGWAAGASSNRWRNCWRSVLTGNWGMSMPLCKSATLRNGVAEGQAPAQMPQRAQRSASTTASSWPVLPLGCATMWMAA